MTWIRLDSSREGLAAFPDGYTVVGTDQLGDVLAADASGKVWHFPHDTSRVPWQDRWPAFDTMELLHEHVAFQSNFEPPAHDEDLPALQARKQAIQRFVKGRRGAPFTRRAAQSALESLREEIEDKRFHASKKGRALAECQALGQRCEQTLRDAGSSAAWICRSAAPDGSVLAVMGAFEPPWTEQRVTGLLTPLLAKRKLVCKKNPN
ncbi:MAG TPA: hypothetical protein VF384_13010 [Planctomycetota bacterium]